MMRGFWLGCCAAAASTRFSAGNPSDGCAYGISGNVTWFDSQGTEHDGGWLSRLRSVGKRVQITFGAVPVTAPNGSAWRQVVWVDCRR